MVRPLAIVLSVSVGLSAAAPGTTVEPRAAVFDTSRATVHALIAEDCPSDGARQRPLPGSRTSLATDVVALHGRGAWIVGMHAGKGIPRRPWIVRRTASGWREVAAAPTGYDGGLMAVDTLSADLAWAVGFHTTSRFLRPISQRWDGRRWRAVGVPSAARSEALVDVAIASAASVWTVGYRTTDRGPAPVALEHRAGRWLRHDPDLPTGTFGSLVAVDAAPDGAIWAAGWQGDGRSPRPLLLRFQGGRWSTVALPRVPPAETVLTDVQAAGGGRISVLGYTQQGTEQRAVLWQREASAWSIDDQLTSIAGSMMPEGLVSDGVGRPVIGGAWRGTEGRGFAAMVGIRTADGWLIARAPDGLNGPSHLRGVAWVDGAALAVGWTGSEGVAATICAADDVPLATAGATGGGRRPHERTTNAPSRDGRRTGGRRASSAAAATISRTRFRDVAARVGLPAPTASYGATVLDLDGDGWDDLLLSRHTEQGRLLRNRNGHFVAAAGDPLPAPDRHGCAAADVDLDGHVDAYCAVGAARGAKLKTNELWTDLETARPRQVSVAMGVDDPLGRGRRAAFLDLDGDPYPDLLVTSDPLRVDGLPSLARAFLDGEGRRFVPAGELGLELPIGGACALSADLDGDGRSEVLMCTEESWGSGVGIHIFRRVGGRFRDATRALGVTPAGVVDAASADLDGDGRADLVQLSQTRLTVSLQRSGRLVRVSSIGVTAGTAIGIGDADGDGHPDLYVVEGGMGRNADDRLLLNRGDGRAFRSVVIPQAGWGTADDVVVLDHDHNGTDDFLVLNGAHGAGPVQLIAGFR